MKEETALFFRYYLNASSAINMILLKFEKSKKNLQNFQSIKNQYEEYINSLNYNGLKCPYCNSTELIRYGGYNRSFTYIDTGEITSVVIHVKRVKCKECNHTHALIANPIVPYKQSGLDIILSCIDNKPITYEYAFDTISKWRKQFSKFYSRLRTMLCKDNIIDTVLDNLYEVYSEFYHINKVILMMTHRGILNMAYF